MVKSEASTVVASLVGVARSGESGQGDGATLAGGEKEDLISYAIGRFDHNGHEIEEKCTDSGGY